MSQTMLQDQVVQQEREQHYQLKMQRKLQFDYDASGAEKPSINWENHLANAKISWGKLTEQELIKSQGSVKTLAGLVRQRYAISYMDAEKQVNAFLKKV